MDVLILNSAVVDLRHESFNFVDKLSGPGGLAKCSPSDLPPYSDAQIKKWIDEGKATVGGPGNTAPLMAAAGLKTAVSVTLGKGASDGLDAAGRFFYDTLSGHHIDMSSTVAHPNLKTGLTFIRESTGEERGGLAYFPNANNAIRFDKYRDDVKRLKPKIVYYMYSGLSNNGDANNGADLADFMRWCQQRGCLTVTDSHTLTGFLKEGTEAGDTWEGYSLLAPVLPFLDIFFTSRDEAQMIGRQILNAKAGDEKNEPAGELLKGLAERFMKGDQTRLFGVTLSDGAWEVHRVPGSKLSPPRKITSFFRGREVIDLVGAGDAFRGGVLTYIANNLEAFQKGTVDFGETVQMGNQFAARFIQSPLNERVSIGPYEDMLKQLREAAGRY